MHQPVRGNRRLPREGLVDAPRRAVRIDQEILRAWREAERRPAGQMPGVAALAGRLRPRRDRAREGRLVAEDAGRIDAAEQHLQDMDRAAGVEAVGMRRDAAHRMHRDRPAEHRLVAPSGPVGPGRIERRRSG